MADAEQPMPRHLQHLKQAVSLAHRHTELLSMTATHCHEANQLRSVFHKIHKYYAHRRKSHEASYFRDAEEICRLLVYKLDNDFPKSLTGADAWLENKVRTSVSKKVFRRFRRHKDEYRVLVYPHVLGKAFQRQYMAPQYRERHVTVAHGRVLLLLRDAQSSVPDINQFLGTTQRHLMELAQVRQVLEARLLDPPQALKQTASELLHALTSYAPGRYALHMTGYVKAAGEAIRQTDGDRGFVAIEKLMRNTFGLARQLAHTSNECERCKDMEFKPKWLNETRQKFHKRQQQTAHCKKPCGSLADRPGIYDNDEAISRVIGHKWEADLARHTASERARQIARAARTAQIARDEIVETGGGGGGAAVRVQSSAQTAAQAAAEHDEDKEHDEDEEHKDQEKHEEHEEHEDTNSFVVRGQTSGYGDDSEFVPESDTDDDDVSTPPPPPPRRKKVTAHMAHMAHRAVKKVRAKAKKGGRRRSRRRSSKGRQRRSGSESQ
ncbi:hypothetical protein OAM67_00775 [bacterium]|nr:hypothetical protein [bacterium]